MKRYCIKTDNVISLPQTLTNQYKNVVGGFDLLSVAELEEYNFYPYVEPVYDPILQELVDLIFDPDTKTVTHTIVDKQFDLASILQRRLAEFEQFQKDFRREITELFLEEIALGTLPDSVKRLIVLLQERRAQVIAELQGFYNASNIERLLNYSFYTDETEQFKMALTMLKD